MTEAGRRVLGIAAGQPDGSAEILLKAALRAAEAGGAEVELVRLTELHLASGPPEDADWLWERLVECDGLIVSTPIISRTVAARLKLLADRLLGPNADAAIIEELLAVRRAGGTPAVAFRVDERVLKPRVAGFLAVGGSLTPQWKALALPILHTITFSMHIAVVDQVVFEGAGTPRSIVLDPAAVDRAAALGRHVAGQLGRAFEDTRYVGPPGLCPLCHLDVVSLRGTGVQCATCGARGELGPDGAVSWTDLTSSVISMAEKRAHAKEIQATAVRQQARRADIERQAAEFAGYDRRVHPRPAPAPRLDHVGLNVEDLVRAEGWYREAFGLARELAVRVEPADLDIVMLRHPESGYRLELLHRNGSRPGPRAADPAQAALTEGFGHLAFDVNELDRAYRRLLDLGARAILAPQPSPEPGVRMCFVADPEGNLIELLERKAD